QVVPDAAEDRGGQQRPVLEGLEVQPPTHLLPRGRGAKTSDERLEQRPGPAGRLGHERVLPQGKPWCSFRREQSVVLRRPEETSRIRGRGRGVSRSPEDPSILSLATNQSERSQPEAIT